MRLVLRVIIGVVFLAALLFPPWRVTWKADASYPAPVTPEETWAGLHPWTFSRERPTNVIAWDGPNTGGHSVLTGEPHVALVPWAALVFVTGAVFYAVLRTRRTRPDVHHE